MKEALENTLNQFLDVIPKLVAAIAVLIIGWIIAKVISNIILRLLRIMKIDVLGEKLNDIEFLQSANVEIQFSQVISKTIYYILMLVFISLAAEMLALDLVKQQVEDFINYLPNIFSALLVLIGGLVIANIIKGFLDAAFKSLGIPSGKFLSGFVFYFIFISVALSAMTQAKINTMFIQNNLSYIILGVVIAFAIGYGFASRNIMANLLASLYSKSKFYIGQDIKINDVRGTIVEIDSTSITIETSDRRVIFPLNKLTTEKVEIFGNWSTDLLE